MLKSCEQKCQAIKGNRQVMSPRRVQCGGGGNVEVANFAGSYFGGVILPALLICAVLLSGGC
jgi:hypothetical protein